MEPTAADVALVIDEANRLLTTIGNLINSANPVVYTLFLSAIKAFLQALIRHLETIYFILAIDEMNVVIDNTLFQGIDSAGNEISFAQLRPIYNTVIACENADPNIELTCLVNTLAQYTAISEAVHTRIVNETKAILTPTANIDTLVTHYKNAIQNAFGVNFTVELNADDWHLVSLHFARLGMEATAKAFARAVTQLAPSLTSFVNRYDVFQRVMGNMEFQNKSDEQSNVAQTFQLQQGARIEVYRNADTDRQRVMTPNNLIHELGHALDGRAGFGFKKLGSMEETMRGTTLPLTRDSMGPTYLRVQFYEHARIVDDSDIFDRAPLGNKEPAPPQNPTNEYYEQLYLMGDIFSIIYDRWQRSEYVDLYGTNARIDTFVQNDDTLTETEPVADAFLSWVRESFDSSSTGQDWDDFFSDNIGMFLRNAVIYGIGMVNYYQSSNVGLIPSSPVMNGSMNSTYENYGIHPSAEEINDGTSAFLNWGAAQNLLPPNFSIYGWFTPSIPISDGSSYWLLVADANGRLGWLESNAVNHDSNLLNTNNQVNASALSPSRGFDSENDTLNIIGN